MHDRMYDLIHMLLDGSASLSENMFAIIAACENGTVERAGARLRELSYESELENLHNHWLSHVFRKDPPVSAAITGLWFGIFYPIYNNEAVTDCYVAGSPEYEVDVEADWASCPAYFPEGRYAHSEILKAVHQVSCGSDSKEFLCLGYVAFAVKHLLSRIDPAAVLKPGATVGVAVGWDSGDALYIGKMTPNGFHVRNSAEAVRSWQERRERFEKRWPRLPVEPGNEN